VPENPVLEKGDSGVPEVDYWKITMDNIHGTHIQGQLARPAKGDQFPALFIPQWADVYPLDKKWVTDRETSYFLRMFLSCYRAADYLSKRPDWNGKVFLVSGGSQGGLQTFVTAALVKGEPAPIEPNSAAQ
jgi:cephalosporin-C deacetylase